MMLVVVVAIAVISMNPTVPVPIVWTPVDSCSMWKLPYPNVLAVPLLALVVVVNVHMVDHTGYHNIAHFVHTDRRGCHDLAMHSPS